MKSIRLTKTLKDEIVNNALKEYRKLHKDESISYRNSFSGALYNEAYGRYFDILRCMPTSWVVYSTRLHYYLEEDRTNNNVEMAESRIMPANNYDSFCIGKDSRLYQLYKEWRNAEKSYRGKESSFYETVYKILDSVTTIKRLISVWPESTKYIPSDILGETSENLPANMKLIQQVNAVLGLNDEQSVIVSDKEEIVDVCPVNVYEKAQR